MSTKKPQSVYQLKITLVGSKPSIWRRILVPGNIGLSRLHDVIQTAMGWSDSHLHQFIWGRQAFGVPDPEDGFLGDIEDEKKVKLSQLLVAEKDALKYEYDFGDSWMHKIVLEKVLPHDPATKVPVCITGKRACPPEDCGGIYGYEQLVEAFSDPKHPEHEDTVEYVGEDFDSEYFDPDEVNASLKR